MKFSMERKNAFWLSLGITMVLACAPIIAHAAQSVVTGAPSSQPQTGQPTPQIGHDAQPQPLNPDQRDARRNIPGAYRLTYIMTEMDGSRQVGSQRYQMVMDADTSWTNLNLGTRIPIATAILGAKDLSPQTQVSYVDVGMNIRAELRQFSNGLELRNRIVQSAVDAQQLTSKTPIIRQTTLESTVLLNENQPVVLGKADIPGSTHSLQIQVELTKLP